MNPMKSSKCIASSLIALAAFTASSRFTEAQLRRPIQGTVLAPVPAQPAPGPIVVVGPRAPQGSVVVAPQYPGQYPRQHPGFRHGPRLSYEEQLLRSLSFPEQQCVQEARTASIQENQRFGFNNPAMQLLLQDQIQLCRNVTLNPPAPVRCYNRVMSGQVNWAIAAQFGRFHTRGETRNDWQPQNALRLCQGTINAPARISCFEQVIASRPGDLNAWNQAIDHCSYVASSIHSPIVHVR